MNKSGIMKLDNRLIDELQYCNDEDFVDRVLMYVAGGETFSQYEIAVSDEEEYHEF